MAISVFPVPVSSSINASAITAVSANTLYEGRASFDAAIYQITCASTTITNFQFLSGAGTIITTGVTASEQCQLTLQHQQIEYVYGLTLVQILLFQLQKLQQH